MLFLWDGGLANLFRWQALLFLFGGMFVAALVVGAVSHFVHRKVATVLSKQWSAHEAVPGGQSGRVLAVGYALLAFRWGIGILFLLWCYNSFFWSQG